MAEKIAQIYDKLFKKILTLSSVAVTNLINGLFGTDYPPDSKITYNWTESESKDLTRRLADTIVTIGCSHSYHMEAQMERDNDIVLRVFEYGFGHAYQNRQKAGERLIYYFPEPKIIYLYCEGNIPATYELTLDFGAQGGFLYRVPVLKLPDITAQELNDRKMIALIPFHLLKLRKLSEEKYSEENITKLTYLIQNDIIQNIENNLNVGNITVADARQLMSYTRLLYRHIYTRYAEMEVIAEMTDESIMTEVDLFYKELDEKIRQIAELDSAIVEKENAIAEKDNTIAEKDNTIAEKDNTIAEKDNTIAEKDNTIARQNAEIQRLQALLNNQQ
ncbi:MAG: hypothetical protein K2K63_13490 [Acetatifactor sp.]|nr:hypothetical protein [Acetatifactor sp.]